MIKAILGTIIIFFVFIIILFVAGACIISSELSRKEEKYNDEKRIGRRK